jgi:hypothetical protein
VTTLWPAAPSVRFTCTALRPFPHFIMIGNTLVFALDALCSFYSCRFIPIGRIE